MPICVKCGQEKSETDFAVRNAATGRKHRHCRDCQSEYRRRHYVNNRRKYLKKANVWNRKNPLNGTYHRVKRHYKGGYHEFVAEVEKLIKESAGRCQACGRSEKLCVDHCHLTGRLRGMLCNRCNIVLGLAKEDGQVFLSLIRYMREHGGHQPCSQVSKT
jgi:hypothetical protein